MNRILSFISIAVMSIAVQAADWQYINKDNVNLRSGASQSAKVVAKAQLGMVVEPISKEGTWTKVRTLSGKEMYVSSQFLAPLPEEELKADYCLITPQTKEDALYELGYSQFKSDGKSETTTRWIPIGEENNDNVKADYTWTYADINGRMNTTEKFYIGKKRGWYIILTDETDSDYKNPQKLDTPIYIYQLYSPTTGIYVNDEYFPSAGGFDDDEWG